MRTRRETIRPLGTGIVACMLACALAATTARAQTLISSCNTAVTKSGVLLNDLECSDSTMPAIRIFKNGTLDLAGFTINGGRDGVFCFGNCAIIGPGTIRGAADYGILAIEGRATVDSVTVEGSRFGIHSKKLELRDSTVSGAANIGVLVTRDLRCHGSEISFNTEYGVGSHRVVFDGCTVRENGYGVRAFRAKVANSSISDNQQAGLGIGRVLKITDSTALNNGTLPSCDWTACADVLASRLRATNLTCGTSAVGDDYEPTGGTWGVCAQD